MKKRNDILKVTIDSPAAAGAGTQAKLIGKHFNLLVLDPGRIYRYVAYIKITEPLKYNYKYIKKKIDKLKMKDLHNKKLSSDKVATVASIIAKDKKIRKLVHAFQLECAYNPPKKYAGSCLDGRDIGSVVIKDADVSNEKTLFHISAVPKNSDSNELGLVEKSIRVYVNGVRKTDFSYDASQVAIKFASFTFNKLDIINLCD